MTFLAIAPWLCAGLLVVIIALLIALGIGGRKSSGGLGLYGRTFLPTKDD